MTSRIKTNNIEFVQIALMLSRQYIVNFDSRLKLFLETINKCKNKFIAIKNSAKANKI